ncbi:MAG: DNA/RNA non-specific endonuclease [Gemmatimonadaceae bacterium]|nr:DNA/RNA non-specific endonuclease [Gloeobacterales cyanobacterium ES-bin-141]
MVIPTASIATTLEALGFDPVELARSLTGHKPIDNEPPERRKAVLENARALGTDAVERILDKSDLFGINYLSQGLVAAQPVARLHVRDFLTGKRHDWATGFLISPRLLLTNYHVFASADQAAKSQAEFSHELDDRAKPKPTERFALDPKAFFVSDEKLDFALIAVAPTAETTGRPLLDFGYLPLNPKTGKVSPGDSLSIVQHPEGDYKQIALRDNMLLKIDEDTLWYSTDTARGSSGSPVFNDFWQVVALHRSGVPAKNERDESLAIGGGLWTKEMGETKRLYLANEGVRISKIVAAVLAARGDHPLIQGIFETVGTPTPEPTSGPEQPNLESRMNTSSDNVTAANGELTLPVVAHNVGGNPAILTSDKPLRLVVPLTITIEFGGVGGTVQDVAYVSADATQERASARRNYSDRRGYDPSFLGVGPAVPLPKLNPAMAQKAAVNTQAAAGTEPHVLPYQHFSLAMNKERKLAFYTAVNIDGAASRRLPRDKDSWVSDPRIGANEQTDDALYKNNQLDRGHLVRRLDPVWGPDEATAKVANDDTFHFTNCSPQHERFNQNDATWQGLENYILDNADVENLRVSVFTGPVLSPTDKKYRGVQVPQQFWKVLVFMKPGAKLSATAYLLTQVELVKDIELFSDDREVASFQVTVQQLEQLTGLDFGNLTTFDPLETRESTGVRIALTDYGKLVL